MALKLEILVGASFAVLLGRGASHVEDRETAVVLLVERTAVHVQGTGDRIAKARGHVASVGPHVFGPSRSPETNGIVRHP